MSDEDPPPGAAPGAADAPMSAAAESHPTIAPDVAAWSPAQPGSGLVRADLLGTFAFVVVIAIGIPLRDERPAQISVGAVSMLLFVIGAVGCLWAYVSALERSRVDEIGVANLYLLTGRTAPPKVKMLMSALLGTQVVVALGGAIIGAIGLTGSQVNALAFGILVPMFGLAMNSLWAVRHGAYGPRIDQSVQPSNRKIG